MEPTDTTTNTPGAGAAPRIHPPLLVLGLIAGGLILHFMLPEPRNVGWNHVVGLILVAGGIGACFYAAAIFQARATTKNPYGEPSEFVVQLPYTFTRNPMYLGFTTMLIGVAFFFDSLVMLLGPAVFFSVMDRLVIPNEERTMESLFGQSYLDYKQRVRRWI